MNRGAFESRAGRNVASPVAVETETLVLRATPSIKRYNIARFDVPELPRFNGCAQPVMMYREPERVPDEDEEKEDEAPIGYNPALRKRRRRRRKDTRTAGWVIEDSEVEQWFRFKKPLNYRTLTLEEAEEMNNEKKRAVERWLMKHKLAGEDKNEATGDTVSAPRVRTGALASASKTVAKEGEDIFGVTEAKPRRVVRPKRSTGGGATGEDGGDFEEKFDDDESDAEIHQDEPAGLESDSEEDEFEVDPEGTGKLTETGQAMKDLLKRAQNGEMLENNKEKEEDDDDEEDDNFTAKDMDVIKRDLGGNIIRDRSVATGSGESGAAGDVKTGVADNSSAADANGKAKSAAASADASNGKRKAVEGHKEETPSKMAKTSAASSANKLTEAGVQQELIRYGGRMRTRDLLRKLKKLIVTDNDKALLKDILRTICDVEVDAIDGRLLVLKSQFR
ncbi:hypothetical protein BBO99_00003221 [Phytophthora kernoviae]|uniref:Transcription initiation factor IIF subunit alpha n=2 Tax=Phytophthora kernoviae TaxID=325452 RepID=A0A3R7J9A4_9STRA|nr:hypothetical protein G195_010592 [Phytophthora kernoviae 00238/432]KAG2525272.1 hypothetical protein JM16_003227 [Phytophthora kernoviae]KAG2526953.1 hypothetical protein JM18_003331 [Phytophthora kernoviae]RLN10945.1 hypothetical protein BBI17_000733 [Phytophthora kernoviae]RLN82037.1 hypothetical protein BBO99_00003221 [Phytophthora kernoviae]